MNKKTEKISISTEHITLAQFLKFADVIASGGEAKNFLRNNKVLINNELDCRRGRKLREGDIIEVSNKAFEIVRQ